MNTPIAMTPASLLGMKDQLVLFIDFLGFANATKDEKKMADLLNVLQQATAFVGETAYAEIPAAFFPHDSGPVLPEDAPVSKSIKPAVSAFSDHIVMSLPLENLKKFDPISPIANGLSTFNFIVSIIAKGGLESGLLIRGGASIGKLIHSNGLIFGEALVDAYEIESKGAIYPRIVLSDAIVTAVQAERGHWGLFHKEDFDGLYYLDYYHQLILMAAHYSPHEENREAEAWLSNVRKMIGDNLKKKNALSPYNKWFWFNSVFEQAVCAAWPELKISTASQRGRG